MAKYIEITVRADIPDDNEELGHDAIVQTRDPVAAIVELLATIGLQNATSTRRIGSTKKKATPAAAAPVALAEAAE
jgi:hypothetical protein